jgi:hypothetical protein
MSTDGKTGEAMREYSRRDFFTSGSKDMLRDVLRAWHGFSEEKRKEETKLTCAEAARKVFSRTTGKNSLLKNVIKK